MDSKKPSRRKFLTTSAAVAGLAVGGSSARKRADGSI